MIDTIRKIQSEATRRGQRGETREQLLERARAMTAGDEVQVVGYSEAELAKRAEACATIARLDEVRRREAVALGERLEALNAAPAPADDAPQTKRSAGCGLEPPPDTHQPFPLVRVRARGVPHSHARPSRPGSAPQPPTAPRQPPEAPPGPTRLAQLAARLRAALQGLLRAGVCGW